jgi:hypothetical protein
MCVLGVFFFTSCEEKDDDGTGADYDPSALVELQTFLPDAGRIREKVIIKGSNFGNDLSQVKVYFIDELSERESTVIGVNNNTIYCSL